MKRELHAYMAHDGEPDEWAILVFAHTAKKAKVLAYPVLFSLSMDSRTYINIRAKRLKGEALHLRRSEEPHVVENPPGCERCERWHTEPLIGGLCVDCFEDDDSWEE